MLKPEIASQKACKDPAGGNGLARGDSIECACEEANVKQWSYT